jgi:hypothetical protein
MAIVEHETNQSTFFNDSHLCIRDISAIALCSGSSSPVVNSTDPTGLVDPP